VTTEPWYVKSDGINDCWNHGTADGRERPSGAGERQPELAARLATETAAFLAQV
jgi:hypothetical protein